MAHRAKSEGEKSLKKPSSAYHHGDLRNALIQAGLEILKTEGPHQLSLREAARIAGVSQAAPYRHFTNKEALLAAIAQQGVVLLGKMARQAADDHASNPEEQLHQVALAYLRFSIDHPHHFRLIFGSIFPLRVEDHQELSQAARITFAELLRVIVAGQQSGILTEGNSRCIAMKVWAAIHGLCTMFVDNRLEFLGDERGSPPAAMRDLTETLLNGLRK